MTTNGNTNAMMPGRRRRVANTAFLSLLLLVSGCGGSTTPAETPSASPGCAKTNDAYAKAVLADSPVAYYRLDEEAGPTLCDASTSHNQGSYAAGGVTFGQPGALHAGDTAIAANGSAQVATSTANSRISGSTNFTLEGWFQTTTKQDEVVVDIGQGGAQRMAGVGPWSNHVSPTYVVTPGTGDYIAFDTFDGTFEFDASSIGINVFDGHWHYTAASFSASSAMVTVYLDNHALGSTAVPDQPAGSPIRIGFWVDTFYNQPFNGRLDEVAVYPSALTANQIAHHYKAAAA